MNDQPDPADLAAADEDRAEMATIERALDGARHNLAHYLYVLEAHEPDPVIDRWIDLTYRQLADLTPDQMKRAILHLIRNDASRQARNLFRHTRPNDAEIRYACDLWEEQGYGRP